MNFDLLIFKEAKKQKSLQILWRGCKILNILESVLQLILHIPDLVKQKDIVFCPLTYVKYVQFVRRKKNEIWSIFISYYVYNFLLRKIMSFSVPLITRILYIFSRCYSVDVLLNSKMEFCLY